MKAMMRHLLSILLAIVLGVFGATAIFPAMAPAAQENGAVVLMYHRFGEADYPSTNVQLAQIDAHIKMLQDGDFTVLPLPDIIAAFENGDPLPDRTIAITIDDAFRSIYEIAWPKFRDAGFPFTIFVATDLVDRGHGNYMSWDQLRELQTAGVTIGNHSVTHPHLPDRDLTVVRREIVDAQARLTEELGAAPSLFAYPFGETSSEIMELVTELGFTAAFGQHSAVSFAEHDRFYLPRFALNENFGNTDRFNLIVNALPLRAMDLTPADPTLRSNNPPAFGFTLDPAPGDIGRLNCFAFAQGGSIDLSLQRLGGTRVEVRLAHALPRGRGRINCTMPADDDRWRWFGMQYYVPAR